MGGDQESVKGDPLSILWKVVSVNGTVSRRLYVCVGFGLMIFKYLVEMLVVQAFTQLFFSPIQFCVPSILLRDQIYQVAPSWLPWAMALWSIPFLWIAVTMTFRRAVDAGQSPLHFLWIFIPVVNLVAMLVFALLPTKAVGDGTVKVQATSQPEGSASFGKTELLSAGAGLLIGGLFSLLLVVISVYTMHNYGSSLFLGMPLVAGCASAFVFNQPRVKGAWASFLVGVLCVILGEAVLLVFALEGVICLVMAAPLMIPLGGFGGLLGWALAQIIVKQSRMMLGSVLFIVMPVLSFAEIQLKTFEELVVESSIVIDASPAEVWANVVDFPDIQSPPAWYFRLGVASPLRANIYGEGVGAVRHCEFTTGSFIEPITVWDEPNHLAFDVVDQPDPLTELTPYESVHPPHLEHSFRSHRGEFELLELPDGRTKLIGRTWYSLDMGPRAYWRMWTDEIIHRIHLRVLNHIREQAER